MVRGWLVAEVEHEEPCAVGTEVGVYSLGAGRSYQVVDSAVAGTGELLGYVDVVEFEL